MRRWRPALSLSIIFMLFAVGTAMAPTVEDAGLDPKYLELRANRASEPPTLLPWPEDYCASPCAVPIADPLPTKPTSTTTSTTTTAAANANVVAASPPAPRLPAPAPAPRPVEEWRSLVSSYFAPTDVDKALRVISCESGGDPNAQNPSSGAAGLFQHIPRYWAERAALVGLPGASIFDPVANVAAAAYLAYTVGWSPWAASAGCW
ncbi:MAG TPA: transglycosylase SLT domain-containing protein [Acidimicrobiia bacterium]|nr:transglycosylase SLT domain-containing protein [Acidimicrobiia bacterium]